ncbi:hypothetical protein PanWU01x14_361570 [Parasponia andersonii]|uniref:Uncharacterized protein n=1 Tax=Parasponia andersonii TaxID=3476 RepID=A0A2P5A7A0_PARAD|nr:hypothetical protein PanWU01x14_361570 [Parasponia andersonii]
MAGPNSSKNSIHSLDSLGKLSSSKIVENFDMNIIYSKKDGAMVDMALFSQNDVNDSFHECLMIPVG